MLLSLTLVNINNNKVYFKIIIMLVRLSNLFERSPIAITDYSRVVVDALLRNRSIGHGAGGGPGLLTRSRRCCALIER